jgi:hypothetical protein
VLRFEVDVICTSSNMDLDCILVLKLCILDEITRIQLVPVVQQEDCLVVWDLMMLAIGTRYPLEVMILNAVKKS